MISHEADRMILAGLMRSIIFLMQDRLFCTHLLPPSVAGVSRTDENQLSAPALSCSPATPTLY
ncbi:hypothetical protein AB0H88_46580 [Nonomuraea sp. NPDC050680]|uniref:hypothetical protein n=1 Tax=Nonomuraea sp. NPDC050680 TaxID=3154630 RepID=UPI003411AAC3